MPIEDLGHLGGIIARGDRLPQDLFRKLILDQLCLLLLPIATDQLHALPHRLLAAQKEFQLQNMIGQLSDDAQTVLKLRFVEGLATKEIAQRMDRSDASVRVLLTRTVKKLQADVGLEHLTD